MVINLLNLFFPKICLGCQNYLTDNEVQICTSCRHELPLTNFHFDKSNAVHKMLYGRVKLEEATALLHFSKKGIVQQLMHNLKYRGHEVIGTILGEWLGDTLKDSETYTSIDAVIPVPLYKSKQRQRGYNQVQKFGEALAKALDADFYSDVLIKPTATKTQVFKDRLKRSANTKSNFIISDKHNLTGKHVLLVDDIITTGATIESCADALSVVDNLKLSIATMAITD